MYIFFFSILATPFIVTFQIIFPKEPVVIVDPNGIDYTIEYYIYSMKDIERLIIRSVYCTQEIILECIDAGLDINATSGYGWYSRDGVYQTYWPGNIEGRFVLNRGSYMSAHV